MGNLPLDYLTFGEFADLGRAMMDAACGSWHLNLDELGGEVAKGSEQPGYLELLGGLSVVLHEHLRKDEKSRQEWLEQASEYCEWYEAEKTREYCVARLSQELYRLCLGLLRTKNKPIGNSEALLVLNEQLGQSVEQVELVVPIVPTKSPFTLYIVHAINDIMKRVYKHNHSATRDKRIELGLHIYWNPNVYPRIVQNTRSHFGFDTSGRLSFDALRVPIEAEFLSFLYRLILAARWDGGNDVAAEKVRTLRTAQVVESHAILEECKGLHRDIHTAIHRVERDNDDFYEKLVEGVEGYVLKGKLTSLLEDYASDIARRLLNLKRGGVIVYVAPFQLGLILDHMFSELAGLVDWRVLRAVPTGRKWSPLDQVRVLCYQPFPGEERIKALLPFYIVPYSYYQYKRQPIPKSKAARNDLEFVRRLIIASLKSISPELVSRELEGAEYITLVDAVTRLFQGAEREIRGYLRYV